MRLSARVELSLGGPVDARDPLRLGGGPDDVFAGVAALAALGFDRITVLAADGASAAWLRTAARDLATLGAPATPGSSGMRPDRRTPHR